MAKIMVEAWQCGACGWVWLADEKPKRCAGCKSRQWNSGGSLGQVDITPDAQQSLRDRRRIKKEQRHAQLKADALAGLPAEVPPVMLAKMATRPTDHHPACRCLRCSHPPEVTLPSAPRRRLTGSTH